MKQFNICIDPYYIRGAEIMETNGMTEEDLECASDEDIGWHETEPEPFVGTYTADTAEEAIKLAAKEKRYDPRILFATEIPAPRAYLGFITIQATCPGQNGKAHTYLRDTTIQGIVMANSAEEAAARVEGEIPAMYKESVMAAGVSDSDKMTVTAKDVKAMPVDTPHEWLYINGLAISFILS